VKLKEIYKHKSKKGNKNRKRENKTKIAHKQKTSPNPTKNQETCGNQTETVKEKQEKNSPHGPAHNTTGLRGATHPQRVRRCVVFSP
jgi:hypothetical protein